MGNLFEPMPEGAPASGGWKQQKECILLSRVCSSLAHGLQSLHHPVSPVDGVTWFLG
jgi:hypothetical protein